MFLVGQYDEFIDPIVFIGDLIVIQIGSDLIFRFFDEIAFRSFEFLHIDLRIIRYALNET